MKTTTIHLRNMCCQRCIEAVTNELQSLGLNVSSVKLGIAHYSGGEKNSNQKIETALQKRGFILLSDEEEILVEKIKTATMHLVHHLPEMEKTDFLLSSYLEEQTKVSYRTLSRVFSKHKDIRLEKYFILLKTEKIKDLIENSGFHFSEIADMMGYKSHQHLSAQFRQVTGMTMHDYEKSRKKKRIYVDKL